MTLKIKLSMKSLSCHKSHNTENLNYIEFRCSNWKLLRPIFIFCINILKLQVKRNHRWFSSPQRFTLLLCRWMELDSSKILATHQNDDDRWDQMGFTEQESHIIKNSPCQCQALICNTVFKKSHEHHRKHSHYNPKVHWCLQKHHIFKILKFVQALKVY